MDLLVHPEDGHVTRMWQSTPLETDRYYDMPDHPNHQFVIRRQGAPRRHSDVVLIHITTKPTEGSKKRKIVQSGRIQVLSAIAGRNSDTGEPRKHTYKVELHPDKPIWPLTDLVDQLMRADVGRYQITPMDAGYTLFDNCAAHSDPEMLTDTDGKLDKSARGGNDELLDSIDFVVTDAAWAILHFPDNAISTGVSHIYLWPEAADKAGELLDIVRKLEAEAV